MSILRDKAINLAANVVLNDSDTAICLSSEIRLYTSKSIPKIIAGDSAYSDVCYSGYFLSESFGNLHDSFDEWVWGECYDHSGEFNLVDPRLTNTRKTMRPLEAMVRPTLAGLVDFSRIVVLRTGSDFDRPRPGVDPICHFIQAHQGCFPISIQNILLAGRSFVDDVVKNWDSYKDGVATSSYLGDIFGSLSYLRYGPHNFGTRVEGDVLCKK